MNKNVGVSFTLSVFTVLLFAVMLYQPDTPPPPSHPVAKTAPEPAAVAQGEIVEAREPEPVVAAPTAARPARSTSAETVARREPVPVANGPESVSRPTARNDGPPLPARPEAVVIAPNPIPMRPIASASRPATPERIARGDIPSRLPEPRGPFTRVRDGESLFDIALRVYGSGNAADSLWKANRDLIDREDTPLREGALLRTP
jgi:nucleoid-associated protein YgaU